MKTPVKMLSASVTERRSDFMRIWVGLLATYRINVFGTVGDFAKVSAVVGAVCLAGDWNNSVAIFIFVAL